MKASARPSPVRADDIFNFSDEYLEQFREISPEQVLRFLDDFRRLHGSKPAPSKLISLKVPEDLLQAFKAKASMAGTPYQTRIKALMKAWVLDGENAP